MRTELEQRGRVELAAMRRLDRPYYWAVGFFGIFVNLLVLTGPIYMLEIYGRVLNSRSIETLVVLSLLAGFLFLLMGVFDVVRSRILARIGARLHDRLRARLHAGNAAPSGSGPADDLVVIERVYAGPLLAAIYDAFWVPPFALALALVHPWLGGLALLGGATLLGLAFANRLVLAGQPADGPRRANDISCWFMGGVRTLRLMLQSAVLGLGALLVLRQELSPAAMIAASVLLGRALAPLEVIAAQLPMAEHAMRSWSRLALHVGRDPVQRDTIALPKPDARLDARDLTLRLPQDMRPRLRSLEFSLAPGGALAVIGPTGSGKSLLALALTDALQPTFGEIRLGGIPLGRYSPADLRQYIGYLPQVSSLLPGSIARNIAGPNSDMKDSLVVAAARAARAHEMIQTLPQGYDTLVEPGYPTLSAGQVQRIGLARALYANPTLLVLDEPLTHLDGDGAASLNRMIAEFRAGGGAVVLMTHRHSLAEICDEVLLLDDGECRYRGSPAGLAAAIDLWPHGGIKRRSA